MQSMILAEPYRFVKENREKPVPGAGEVRVKILQVGICGSDIQIYHGLHKYAKLPFVIGHECAARVDALGEGVDAFEPGELVTIQPQFFCGECYPCRHGNTNVCETLSFMGVHQDGLFQEYVVVPEWNIVKTQETDPDRLMFTEPMAVAANAVRKGAVKPGMRVAVVGAGTIGNLVAQTAVAAGGEVVITDILDKRLEIALECGIQHTANTRGVKELRPVFRAAFGGEDADVIFDCAALDFMFEDLMKSAANGSRVVIVGSYKKPVTFDMHVLQRREIELYGAQQYNRADFLKAEELISSGKIRTDIVLTHKFGFDEIQKAFEFIDEDPGRCLKVGIILEK